MAEAEEYVKAFKKVLRRRKRKKGE